MIQAKDVKLLDILIYTKHSQDDDEVKKRIVISTNEEDLEHLSYSPSHIGGTPVVITSNLPGDKYSMTSSSVPYDGLKKERATLKGILFFLIEAQDEWAKNKLKTFYRQAKE